MSKLASVLCYAVVAPDQAVAATSLFAAIRRFHPDWHPLSVAPGPAARAVFLDRACREASTDLVIQLDPRAQVTAPLDPLLAKLDAADILFLARVNQPGETRATMIDTDLMIARTGTFNLGFLAVRTGGEGPAFAAWWADRVTRYPDAVDDGDYLDQRWCDLTPGLFDRVAIVRKAPACLTLPRDRAPFVEVVS